MSFSVVFFFVFLLVGYVMMMQIVLINLMSFWSSVVVSQLYILSVQLVKFSVVLVSVFIRSGDVMGILIVRMVVMRLIVFFEFVDLINLSVRMVVVFMVVGSVMVFEIVLMVLMKLIVKMLISVWVLENLNVEVENVQILVKYVIRSRIVGIGVMSF